MRARSRASSSSRRPSSWTDSSSARATVPSSSSPKSMRGGVRSPRAVALGDAGDRATRWPSRAVIRTRARRLRRGPGRAPRASPSGRSASCCRTSVSGSATRTYAIVRARPAPRRTACRCRASRCTAGPCPTAPARGAEDLGPVGVVLERGQRLRPARPSRRPRGRRGDERDAGADAARRCDRPRRRALTREAPCERRLPEELGCEPRFGDQRLLDPPVGLAPHRRGDDERRRRRARATTAASAREEQLEVEAGARHLRTCSTIEAGD